MFKIGSDEKDVFKYYPGRCILSNKTQYTAYLTREFIEDLDEEMKKILLKEYY